MSVEALPSIDGLVLVENNTSTFKVKQSFDMA
jgi:hypothetical protein